MNKPGAKGGLPDSTSKLLPPPFSKWGWVPWVLNPCTAKGVGEEIPGGFLEEEDHKGWAEPARHSSSLQTPEGICQELGSWKAPAPSF